MLAGVRVSRPWQIVVGGVALVAGAASIGFVLLALLLLPRDTKDSVTTLLVVATLFSLFGVPAFVSGVRLLLDLERRGGGLFSPAALRLAGVVMLALPALFVIAGDRISAVHALTHVGLAGGCFALARQRSRR